MLSPRYPSSSSTCDSVEDNRFSTSAFCHEPFHPITLEIIAGAVDKVATLVDLEIAAAGVAIDAVEHRHAVGEGARFLHREEAVAVDGHEGRDGSGLHVPLHRVS